MSSKSMKTTKNVAASSPLVPKLRFPGFTVPWSYNPLSKVLTEHKLKNTHGREVFSVSMEHGIVNQIELLGRSFAAADTSHYTIGRQHDVVYTKSPLKAFPFGIVKQCKFAGEAALSPLYGVFTPSNPHLGLLIEAYFESPTRSNNFLAPLCQKGAKNTLQITNSTFLSGLLPLPIDSAEQLKIASCLSSLDNLISAQAHKVDALKRHKKGLMQQLFPREGETQPRLRFPEFRGHGEWEERALSGACRMQAGKFVSAADINDSTSGGLFPCYGGNGLRGFTTTFTHDGVYPLIGRQGALCGNVQLASGQFHATEHAVVATPNRGVDVVWLFYLLDLLNLNRFATGQAQPGLSVDVLEKVPIKIPSALAEQQRIASCLSSLDAQIASETRKLDSLKIHKKGLMQGLFPEMSYL
jgi:type I restriction enzyme S subunit